MPSILAKTLRQTFRLEIWSSLVLSRLQPLMVFDIRNKRHLPTNLGLEIGAGREQVSLDPFFDLSPKKRDQAIAIVKQIEAVIKGENK
jgi:hypothetical protein